MEVGPPPSPVRTAAPPSRQFGLGIVLLLCVVGLWVSSSFLMSSIFRDQEFNSPWLVTWICTSSFSFYLVRPALSYLSRRAMSGLESRMSKDQSNRGAYEPIPEETSGSASNQNLDSPPRERSVSRAYEAPERPMTPKEVAELAGWFVGLWFAANWTVNASLGYTSVSSTTILSSMSGFFTLGIGAVLGVEKFDAARLVAVAASVAGVVLVSKADHDIAAAAVDHAGNLVDSQASKNILLGDGLALSSAMLYACYVLLMKVKVKDESRVDMQLFFGCVGLFNIVFFWPIGVILHYTGIEPFRLPNSGALWASVLLNAAITFVSDYLYMLAMLKTSPLVVTLGLSLTLPVAVAGDVFKGATVEGMALVGACLVLSSFVLLSLVQRDGEEEQQERS